MNLYERIKEVAKEKGYSINRLEKELGFARSSMNKFKTSTPSVEKIKTIAEFLGVSVDDLMGKEIHIKTEFPAGYFDEMEKNLLLHFRNAAVTKEQKEALGKMLCSNIDVYIDFVKGNKK